MATMIKIKAQKREASLKSFSQVLGVIYGHNKENISITMDYNEFEKVFNEAGMSSVITIDIEGDEHNVVIKDVQIDPRKDRFHHVDFYEFTKGQKMEATVSLKFIGEAPAEKLGMVLNTAMTEISISSLPKNLPSEIEVDLSVLIDGNSSIRLADINLPEDVEIIGDSEEAVVSVVAAREVGEEDNNDEPDLSVEDDNEGDDKKEEDKKE